MTINFDGTIFYFPDLANNKIYTKQVNPMNGMAQLHVYELKEQLIQSQSTPPQNNNYITREEFEKAIAELRKQSTPSMPVATPQVVDQCNNVSSSIYLDVPAGYCVTISVKNTGAIPLLVQNANLIAE